MTTKPACHSCYFWTPPQAERDAGFGTCDAIPTTTDEPHTAPDYKVQDLALVCQTEYQLPLRCKPDFGCVLHAPRPVRAGQK